MTVFVTFVVAIVSLAVLGAAFAFTLYLLLRNRLDKTNTLTVKREKSPNRFPASPSTSSEDASPTKPAIWTTLATLTLTGDKVELDDQGKVIKTEI